MLRQRMISEIQGLKIRKVFLERSKVLITSPFSWSILLSFIITIALVIYFVTAVFTRYPVSVKVMIHSTYLEVIELNPGMPALKTFFTVGDRVVSLDGTSVEQILTENDKDYATNKILAYYSQGTTNEYSIPGNQIKELFKPGQVVVWWSTSATKLTLERASYNPEICNCNSDNFKPVTKQIYLEELFGATHQNTLRLIVAFLICLAFSFVASGIALYLMSPNQLITGVLSQFFNLVILQQIATNSEPFRYGVIEKATTITAFTLIAPLFFHFVALFPHGNLANSRIKSLIKFCYGGATFLILVRVYLALFVLPTLNLPLLENTLRATSYLFLIILFSTALIILLVKFFKSNGQDRLRLRLAVFSLILTISIPLLSFILYLVVDSLKPVLGLYFGFAYFPAIFLPPIFTYAVVKNQLLAINLTFRRWAAHIFLYLLIAFTFLTISSLAGLFFPEISNNNFISALIILLLLQLVDRIKLFVLKLIDKLFEVDTLDYTSLNNQWNNLLVKSNKLDDIFELVLSRLPVDYFYKSVQLLLFEPTIIKSLLKPALLEQPGLKTALLTSKPGQPSFATKAVKVEPEFWNTVGKAPYWLIEDPTLPLPIKQALNGLNLTDIKLALPLQIAEEFYGVLLLGRKKSEYFTPPEELGYLTGLANQIAVAIHSSLSLKQALEIARQQEQLRLEREQVIEYEQHTREDERRRLYIAIHNDLLPLVVQIKTRVNNLFHSPEWETTSFLHIEAALDELNEYIRTIISDFSLFDIEYLVLELHTLLDQWQEKAHNFTIHRNFEVDEFLLDENLLNKQIKTALYQIVEELVSNAIKHAQASNIFVSLKLEKISSEEANNNSLWRLEIKVVDDGIGLDISKANNTSRLVANKHFGLNNIHWQVLKCGGNLNFALPPSGKGTQVQIQLYLSQTETFPITSNALVALNSSEV